MVDTALPCLEVQGEGNSPNRCDTAPGDRWSGPHLLPHDTEPRLKLFLSPGGSGGEGDAPQVCAGSRMNLVSMATDPKLQWVALWARIRWAAVLGLLLGLLVVLLLPAVEDQCHTVLQGLSFLKSKLGAGSSGLTRYTGQTTELSVASNGLELLVLKGKASPGKSIPGGQSCCIVTTHTWRSTPPPHDGNECSVPNCELTLAVNSPEASTSLLLVLLCLLEGFPHAFSTIKFYEGNWKTWLLV